MGAKRPKNVQDENTRFFYYYYVRILELKLGDNQGCIYRLDTLDALQCTRNVVFIAKDT